MLRLITLRVLESYFRRPILSLLPLVLLTAAGIFFLFTADPQYMTGGGISVQGEVTLIDKGLGNEGGSLNWGQTVSEKAVAEFNELMASDSFVRAIIASTDYEIDFNDPDVDPDEIFVLVRDDVWADTIGDNNFGIAAKSKDPVVAQQLVQATIDAFRNWKISTGLSEAQTNLDFWRDKFNAEQANFDAAQAELTAYSAAYPKPIRGEEDPVVALEKDRLKAVADEAANRLNEARDKYDGAQLTYKSEQTAVDQKYLIIDTPRVPDEPETSLTSQVITLGIFMTIGALMGIVGVVGSAFLDRSFRYPVDVKQSLELPVLGAIPTGEEFVSRHFQDMGQSVAAAPPPMYRTKLTPNVEPPTLIIMPGEKAELERIALERKEADEQVDLVGSYS